MTDQDYFPKEATDKGTRLPSDWLPDDALVDYARFTCGLNPDEIKMETQNFLDYWLSKPGAAGRKTDWRRTFMTWTRKASERRGKTLPKGVVPPTMAADNVSNRRWLANKHLYAAKYQWANPRQAFKDYCLDLERGKCLAESDPDFPQAPPENP